MALGNGTSKAQPSETPESQVKAAKLYLISQIKRLAAAANVSMSPETVSVYASELAVLNREQLDAAVSRTIREWDKASMMPPLKFILDRAGGNAKLLAEQAFELVWKLVKKNWYADGIGWVEGAEKKLTPAMQYAIRQCGGEYRMSYTIDEESFPFLRRDFLAAHERFTVEGGEQIKLTEGYAASLLDTLSGGNRRQRKSGFESLADIANRDPGKENQ